MTRPTRATAPSTPADHDFDTLVGEVSEKLEAGEPVDPDDFADRHPQHVERLRQLLPTLQAMAELGHRPVAPDPSAPGSEEPPGGAGGTLGDFRILREIGRGGMGVVYQAEQISLKRRVALKVLPFAAVLDQRQLQRFKNEAQAAALLHHQNIVPIYSVGCERGVHFYAMQYVDGQTLGELIGQLRQHSEGRARLQPSRSHPRRNGSPGRARLQPSPGSAKRSGPSGASPAGSAGASPSRSAEERAARPPTPKSDPTTLTLSELATTASTATPAFFRSVAQLGIQVAEALDHAHQQGVIHRDIKPSNLMVDAGGKPWITDFGLARIEANPSLTVSGDLLGTLRYMSPEQALAKRIVVDHRTDIYSLGATLYELVTLHAVFDGTSRQALLRQIAFDEPRAPRKLNKAIPADLETILLKAVAKNPAERYATAQHLADDLHRFLDLKPIHAKRPTVLQRAAKWSRRHKGAVASAMALLVMAVIALAVSTVLIWQEKARTERALGEAEEQRQRADTALENERQARTEAEGQKAQAEQQRERAEANLRLALEVLDEIYVRVAAKQPPRQEQDPKGKDPQPRSEAPAAGEPGDAEQDDEALLRRVLSFYERFAASNSGVTQLRDLVEEVYHKVVTARGKLAEDSPGVVGHRRALALAASGLATLLATAGRNEEAERQYHDAISIQQQLVDTFSSVREYREELAASHRGLAAVLKKAGRDRAADEHREAAGELERRPEPPPKWRIDRPDFPHATGLELVGRAAVADNLLRLAPAQKGPPGVAWLTDKQGVAQGFETTFRFRMTGGADGLAFVIQNHSPSALGAGGCGLGYADIPNSLAVEFDPFYAWDVHERAEAQHVSVQTNGIGPNKASPAFSLGLATPPSRLDDGNVHTAKIRYVPGTLTIFLDDLPAPALTVSVELAATLDLDAGQAWVGFTAATGNRCQAHEILSWRYCLLADPQAALPSGQGRPGRPPGAGRASSNGAAPRAPQDAGPPAASGHPGFLQKALRLYEALAAQHATDPRTRLDIGRAYWRAADIQRRLGDLQRAEAAYRAALRTWADLVDEFPNAPEYSQRLTSGGEAFAYEIIGLASTLSRQGKLEEARKLCEEAMRIMKGLFGPEDPATLFSMRHLAAVLWNQRKLEEAGKLFEAILAIQKRALGFEDPTTLASMDRLARALLDLGKLDEARKLNEQVLAARQRGLGPEHPDTLLSMHILASVLGAQRKLEEARKLHEQTLAGRKRVLGPEHPDTVRTARALASLCSYAAWDLCIGVESSRADRERAVAFAKRAVELRPDVGNNWSNLGVAQYRAENFSEAVAALERAARLAGDGDLYHRFFLAMAYWQLGRRDQARQSYDRAVEWMRNRRPRDGELRRFRAEAAALLGIEAAPVAGKKEVTPSKQ